MSTGLLESWLVLLRVFLADCYSITYYSWPATTPFRKSCMPLVDLRKNKAFCCYRAKGTSGISRVDAAVPGPKPCKPTTGHPPPPYSRVPYEPMIRPTSQIEQLDHQNILPSLELGLWATFSGLIGFTPDHRESGGWRENQRIDGRRASEPDLLFMSMLSTS